MCYTGKCGHEDNMGNCTITNGTCKYEFIEDIDIKFKSLGFIKNKKTDRYERINKNGKLIEFVNLEIAQEYLDQKGWLKRIGELKC